MRHNQETLGNGCLCDSGCESCNRLAEAFEAMREALRATVDRWPQSAAEARAALRLAEEVMRHE
jgi:hypothetical protein